MFIIIDSLKFTFIHVVPQNSQYIEPCNCLLSISPYYIDTFWSFFFLNLRNPLCIIYMFDLPKHLHTHLSLLSYSVEVMCYHVHMYLCMFQVFLVPHWFLWSSIILQVYAYFKTSESTIAPLYPGIYRNHIYMFACSKLPYISFLFLQCKLIILNYY